MSTNNSDGLSERERKLVTAVLDVAVGKLRSVREYSKNDFGEVVVAKHEAVEAIDNDRDRLIAWAVDAVKKSEPTHAVTLEYWAQFYDGGSYAILSTKGANRDLVGRARDAVGYDGWYGGQRLLSGQHTFKLTTLPDVDLCVLAKPEQDLRAMRGFVFIQCFIAPKGLHLDLGRLPFMTNDQVLEIFQRKGRVGIGVADPVTLD